MTSIESKKKAKPKMVVAFVALVPGEEEYRIYKSHFTADKKIWLAVIEDFPTAAYGLVKRSDLD